jgi:hypothetical protein
MVSGIVVAVVAGSAALSNAQGAVEVQVGRAAVMSAAEAPLLVGAPQDDAESLLRRLEQLAASVAKLEQEIARLEERNAKLKEQLRSNAPGGGVWFNGAGAPGGGVRVVTSTNPGTEATIIIEEKKDK